MPNLAALYKYRFRDSDVIAKRALWKTLCTHYFQKLVGNDRRVADLACGYGEFISNIKASKKIAIDLNPETAKHLAPDVELHLSPAHQLTAIPDNSLDVVFTSNFLEHLKSKDDCDAVFLEVLRVLAPGGRFIVMGPNIRYLAAEYWDFYDHYLPLSHLSVEEGLAQAGFAIDTVVPKFLPYTTRSRLPKASFLVALYLKMPLAWKLLGKQFLVVARKAS